MKTRKGLEQNEIFWRTLAIGFLILFILAFFTAIAFQNQIIELKQIIQSYQVPICNLKDGYYGFSVICYDDLFGERNKGKEIDQHYYLSREDCKESLRFYLNYKDCEIIK